MTRTSHFVSVAAVMWYCILQGSNHPRRAARRMIRGGLVSIGEPVLKPGQRLVRVDEGTRYTILNQNN